MTLADVYREHFRFVWRSLRRLGVSEADAPDATQEVFLVVHRRLSEFEGRSRLTTWLFGICLRVAQERRRRAHVRYERADEQALSSEVDERADVGAEAERKQAMRRLEAILDRLDFDQRVVFTLFELEGMRGDEIAALLDVPVPTVHSRLRLAREAFKAEVAREQAREKFMSGKPPQHGGSQ